MLGFNELPHCFPATLVCVAGKQMLAAQEYSSLEGLEIYSACFNFKCREKNKD